MHPLESGKVNVFERSVVVTWEKAHVPGNQSGNLHMVAAPGVDGRTLPLSRSLAGAVAPRAGVATAGSACPPTPAAVAGPLMSLPRAPGSSEPAASANTAAAKGKEARANQRKTADNLVPIDPHLRLETHVFRDLPCIPADSTEPSDG